MKGIIIKKEKIGNIQRIYYKCGDYLDIYPDHRIIIHIRDPDLSDISE